MKKIINILGIAAALCVSAFAQTNAAPDTNTDISTNSTFLTSLWDGFKPLLSATNYAFEPYGTYAPSAPKGSKEGGGLFVAYNVNNYVGAGVALDYLGQFSLVSANCQLKYAIHPFASYGAPNFAIVPFAMAGVGKGMGGSTGAGIITEDIGGYFQFGKLWGGSFNAGAAYGAWENAGKYSGKRYHVFFGWSKGF